LSPFSKFFQAPGAIRWAFLLWVNRSYFVCRCGHNITKKLLLNILRNIWIVQIYLFTCTRIKICQWPHWSEITAFLIITVTIIRTYGQEGYEKQNIIIE